MSPNSPDSSSPDSNSPDARSSPSDSSRPGPTYRRTKAASKRSVFVTAIVSVVLLGLLALGIGSAVLVYKQQQALAPEVVEELRRPDPPTTGYVGNQACVECHAEIAERYQTHPMSHSLTRVGAEDVIEDYQNTSFAPNDAHRYVIEKEDGVVLHHETLIGPDGDVVYDLAEPVNYVLGSGQLGRSYLLERHGVLYQSPIGWYTQGDRWDLAPGYRTAVNPHFRRRIGDGCLYCHVGRVSSEYPGSDRYDDPAFTQESVSCERCHGPGKDHVAHQHALNTSGGNGSEGDDTIVNPARLEPDRRDAVCFQCHLQGEGVIPRYGRTFFTFRPGQRLEDNWVMFVGKTRVDARGNTRAVSQVEQMRASKCYLASDRRMTCTSCHDPHFRPAPEERPRFYQESCLKCHEQQACGLEEAARQAAPAHGSCVHCHMPQLSSEDVPHTTQTDHRILRRPSEASVPDVDFHVPLKDATVFDDASARLPRRAIDRARGIALMSVGGAQDAAGGQHAESLLLAGGVLTEDVGAGLELLGDDIPALLALGTACRIQGRSHEAVICWQEALRYDPKDEQALTLLAMHYHEQNDTQSALEYMNRLIKLTPDVPTLLGRRAHMLGQLGDLSGAIESAYGALKHDPSLTQIREWLVEVHTLRGETEQAEQQQRLLERTRAAYARAAEKAAERSDQEKQPSDQE